MNENSSVNVRSQMWLDPNDGIITTVHESGARATILNYGSGNTERAQKRSVNRIVVIYRIECLCFHNVTKIPTTLLELG